MENKNGQECLCTSVFRKYKFSANFSLVVTGCLNIQGVPGGMCETSGECSLC